MKRIKPQQFLILLLVAALAAAPFLIRGLIDRSDTGKETTAAVTPHAGDHGRAHAHARADAAAVYDRGRVVF